MVIKNKNNHQTDNKNSSSYENFKITMQGNYIPVEKVKIANLSYENRRLLHLFKPSIPHLHEFAFTLTSSVNFSEKL